jgi:hypothetical protein
MKKYSIRDVNGTFVFAYQDKYNDIQYIPGHIYLRNSGRLDKCPIIQNIDEFEKFIVNEYTGLRYKDLEGFAISMKGTMLE